MKPYLSLVLSLVAGACLPASRAAVVVSIAGSGPLGWDNGLFRGEGAPAPGAFLNAPTGVAQGADGSILIADYWNDRVRAVDPVGSIQTVAGDGWPGNQGNGHALNTSLWGPWSVAAKGGGFVFSDTFNASVRQVAADGAITRIAGVISGTPGSQSDPYGGWSGFSGDGGPGSQARLNWPLGVAVDGSGNVYIADSRNNRIRRVDNATGIINTVAGNGRADAFGHGEFAGDGGAATSASLYWPSAVALDGSGNLYIADTYNQRIRRVDAGTGVITTVAGSGNVGDAGDGGPATQAELNYPAGIAVAGDGTLYIADSMNHRIRAVKAGVISAVAGNGTRGLGGDNGPAESAAFNEPRGIALTGTGDLLVADTGNNRVRMVILGETGTVSGRVLDAGTHDPVPGAQVSWNGVVAVANDTGAYTISTRAGAMTLTAGAAFYGPVTETVSVAAGQTTTRDFLLPSGMVAGRVVDDGGHVVAGATVTDEDGSVVSGPDGGFSLRLAPGPHALHVRADGYGASSQDVSVANGQTTNVVLTVYRLQSTGVTLAYDKDWISPHDNPGDFNTPSNDYAFAGEELPDSLGVFSLPVAGSAKVDFVFPNKADGVNNVLFVNGQTLTVPAGHYFGLHMLEASQFGGWDGAISLNYTDGSVQVPMRWSDWAYDTVGNKLGANESIGIQTSHRHNASNAQASPAVTILHSQAAVDRDRSLVSITLPADPSGTHSQDGYIFAMSLDATASGPAYGDVDADLAVGLPDVRMALRAAAGLLVLTPEQAARADLFPAYPGGGFGDGRIGMPDALAILYTLRG